VCVCVCVFCSAPTRAHTHTHTQFKERAEAKRVEDAQKQALTELVSNPLAPLLESLEHLHDADALHSRINDLYDFLDCDGSNSLSKEELNDGLRRLKYTPPIHLGTVLPGPCAPWAMSVLDVYQMSLHSDSFESIIPICCYVHTRAHTHTDHTHTHTQSLSLSLSYTQARTNGSTSW